MGYVDHHVHFLSTVAARLSVDVAGARSLSEIGSVLRSAPPAGPSGWIRAWGYDEAVLAEGRHPTRGDLDRYRSDVPVVLHHRTGHAAVMNTRALELTGATDLPGVEAGVLFDRHEVLARVPRLDPGDLAAAAARVSAEWARDGIDAFVDATATNGPAELDLLAAWCRDGVISQQVTVMVGVSELRRVPPFGATVGPVRVGHAKVMPGPGLAGGVAAAVAAAHRTGFPVAIHVTEVDGLEEALAAVEASRPPAGTVDRVEHNALCLPEQVERIAAAGVAVVVNPSFLLHRRAKYERQLQPVERSWLIRIRSLVDAGVVVRAGSDSPVCPARPSEMMAAAMAHPFSPEESVDPITAAGLLGA